VVTASRFRKLALSLPEVEERSHFGKPDFRVNDKIFAGLSSDGRVGNLKLTSDVQAQVLALTSSAFRPCEGAWGRSGWTYVELALADVRQLEPLIELAWQLKAPQSLSKAHARGEDPAATSEAKRTAKAAQAKRTAKPRRT
jgi:hypothetical protein